MPRSKHPTAYPHIFYELAEYFASSEDTVSIEYPTLRPAIDTRNKWYAFLASLARTARQSTDDAWRAKNTAVRADLLAQAERYSRLHKAALSRQLSIEPPATTKDTPTPIPRTLHWLSKNLLPANRTLEEQFHAQHGEALERIRAAEAAGATTPTAPADDAYSSFLLSPEEGAKLRAEAAQKAPLLDDLLTAPAGDPPEDLSPGDLSEEDLSA